MFQGCMYVSVVFTALVLCVQIVHLPTVKGDPNGRRQWLAAINRADPKKPYALLEPGKQLRVCSRHFVNGHPTTNHPDPELFLGHGNVSKQRATRAGQIIRAQVASSLTSDRTAEVSSEHSLDSWVSAGIGETTDVMSDLWMPYTVLLCVTLLLFVYAGMPRTKCRVLSAENSRLSLTLRLAEHKITKLQNSHNNATSLLNKKATIC